MRALPYRSFLALAALAAGGYDAGADRPPGELDRFESEFEKPGRRRPPERRVDRDADADENLYDDLISDCCSDTFGEVLGLMFVEALTSPFWAPAEALGDDFSPMPLRRRPYPLPPEVPAEGEAETAAPPPGAAVAGTVEGSWQRVSERVEAKRIDLRVRTAWRFGFDFSRTGFEEDLKNHTDEMRRTAAHVTVDFARSPQWTFTAGIGFKELDGDRRRDGPDFLYRVEATPGPPWTFDLSTEWASIRGQSVGEIAAGAGAAAGPVRMRAGWRTLFVGGTDLSGPEFGLTAYW